MSFSEPEYDAFDNADAVSVEDHIFSDTDEIEETEVKPVPVCIDGDNRVWAKTDVFSPESKGINSKIVSEHFPKDGKRFFDMVCEKGSNTSCEDIDISDNEELVDNNFHDISFLAAGSVVTVKATAPPVSAGKGASFHGFRSSSSGIFPNSSAGSELRLRNKKNPSRADGNDSKLGRNLPKVRGKLKDMRKTVSSKSYSKEDFYSLLASKILPNELVGKENLLPEYTIHKNSQDSDTDTEELVLVQGDSKEDLVANKNMADFFVCQEDEVNDDTDFEIFSDDEYVGDKCRWNKTVLEEVTCDDNIIAQTDEEELDLLQAVNDKILKGKGLRKGSTEPDESGSIKQVTKVKTETSVKVVGDEGGAADGEDGISRTTTTTTTRIITTVTTQGGEEEVVEQHVEGGDDLRSSMEAVLSQFMGDDGTSDQQSEPKQD